MRIDEERLRLALEQLGFAEDPAALVRRWSEQRQNLRAATLSWERQEPPGSDVGWWIAAHGNNHFRIDGRAREARLVYVWQGLGERVLEDGSLEALTLRARELVRAGGPFGGPVPTEARPIKPVLGDNFRRFFHARGELRVRMYRTGFLIASFVWPDGGLAFRLITKNEQAAAANTELGTAPPLTLSIAASRVPWRFVDDLPWLGTIHAPPYELLLAVVNPEQVAILAVAEAKILAVHFMAPDEVQSFDVGRWFAALPPLPRSERPPELVAEDQGPQEPAAPKTRTQASTAKPRRQRAEPRVPSLLPELLRRHFAHVAARIPAGVLGAATAHLLWTAIEQAYQRDLPAISGGRNDVYAALRAAEILEELPSEHAGRAALQILAELSPIVRRVHHRRWSLMLPELRDPTSAVIRAIRTREGEAGGRE